MQGKSAPRYLGIRYVISREYLIMYLFKSLYNKLLQHDTLQCTCTHLYFIVYPCSPWFLWNCVLFNWNYQNEYNNNLGTVHTSKQSLFYGITEHLKYLFINTYILRIHINTYILEYILRIHKYITRCYYTEQTLISAHKC